MQAVYYMVKSMDSTASHRVLVGAATEVYPKGDFP